MESAVALPAVNSGYAYATRSILQLHILNTICITVTAIYVVPRNKNKQSITWQNDMHRQMAVRRALMKVHHLKWDRQTNKQMDGQTIAAWLNALLGHN